MNDLTMEEKVVQDTSFVEVPLSDQLPPTEKKTPKRILYFSDGILEEYSSDEENDNESATNQQANSTVDPKSLQWMPYLGHLVSHAGKKMLAAADFVGENLADALGIMPKYEYEIEEYNRRAKKEQKNPKNLNATSSEVIGLTPCSGDLNGKGEDINKGNLPEDSNKGNVPEDSAHWKRY